jgi:hypothetical protein
LVSIWGTMKARAGKKRSGCIIARFARHESGPGRMVTDGPRQSGETRCRRWSGLGAGLFDIGRMDSNRLCRCQGRDAAVRLRHKKTKGCRHRLSEVATLLSFLPASTACVLSRTCLSQRETNHRPCQGKAGKVVS